MQAVGYSTHTNMQTHTHTQWLLEVPLHVCVELQSSAILIITQQPSPLLTFLTSLQSSRVGRLCYGVGAGAQRLKSLLVCRAEMDSDAWRMNPAIVLKQEINYIKHVLNHAEGIMG